MFIHIFIPLATLTFIPFFAAYALAQYKADQDTATLTFAMTKRFTITIPEGGSKTTDLASAVYEDQTREDDAYQTPSPYDPQDEYYDRVEEMPYDEFDPIEDQNDFDLYDGYGNGEFYDDFDDPNDYYDNRKEPEEKTSLTPKGKIQS